ncbi:MAG: alanine racemase, partial [Thermodesulfobacteriota bacterium]|nr:alanine racemase [Thermodesulfobacteriota bacterium]
MNRHFNTVRIDMAALEHNLGQVKKLAGPRVRVMAVVKADAYGHGLVRVGLGLVRAGADSLGVMDLDEAVQLRDAGVDIPVFILAGFEPEHCDEIAARDLTPFVYDLLPAKALN